MRKWGLLYIFELNDPITKDITLFVLILGWAEKSFPFCNSTLNRLPVPTVGNLCIVTIFMYVLLLSCELLNGILGRTMRVYIRYSIASLSVCLWNLTHKDNVIRRSGNFRGKQTYRTIIMKCRPVPFCETFTPKEILLKQGTPET